MSKKVICIETNEIYSSATEAAKANDCCVDMISRVCIGKSKAAKGKTFRYINDEIHNENGENNMSINANRVNTTNSKCKRVMCIETGEIYPSAAEAAKANNCSFQMLTEVCRGSRYAKTAKGKTFRYIDENNNILSVPEAHVTNHEITIQNPAKMIAKGKRCNGNTNAVLCISTGNVYTSCTDAAEQTGTTQASMSRACRINGATTKGKKFCYVKDINEHLDEVTESIRKANMYDELMTKEEKRKELLADVQHWESEVERLDEEMCKLLNAQKEAASNLNIAQHRLMYFN